MPALKWRILFATLFLLILGPAGFPGSPADLAARSPRLLRAVAGGPDDAVFKVWVEFEGRTFSRLELATVLARTEAELTPRAARRRANSSAVGIG